MAAKPAPQQSGSSLDKLPPLAKVGVGALFVVLVGVLYFVGFYADVASEIDAAVKRQQVLQDELAKAQASREAYQKDLDEKTRREQLSREQKKILPDDSETPAFLSAIQGVATISGVNLRSWSPTDEVAQEFFSKVPMRLTLSGKFHQVAKFFHGVGQLDRIINVENIQIKNPKDDKDDFEVQVECLATAFRAVRGGESSPSGTNPKRKGGHK
jgi:type IV pilus assembly protein PilO